MTGTLEFLAPSRDRTQDYFQFLKALIKSPRQTASIVPSSPYLGRMMAAQIDPVGGPVIELGGGTGALTRQILATGLPADNLEVVEINHKLAQGLRHVFPGVSILEVSADSAGTVARHAAGSYQAMISGLPLLAMKPDEQEAILAEAFRLLMPGGAVVQFTYSPRSPVRADVAKGLGLRVTRVGSILRNVPPATVFRICRTAEGD